ncbi:hypothetical protein KL86SPO_60049 [uncultured Sporomusa sp.]|uniref:Uncharacterized protein n=1 Tax=uncultured Sporomusa sp. TaxID=307249 RepID=A0A212M046_9FIRM|nr:hypothetical protein KL86SPO_60049 [uncultured Sporomusa sp.]
MIGMIMVLIKVGTDVITTKMLGGQTGVESEVFGHFRSSIQAEPEFAAVGIGFTIGSVPAVVKFYITIEFEFGERGSSGRAGA